MSESQAPHPLERRASTRHPILLPVRLAVISAGSTKERTLSSIAATCYGLIYDVTPEGVKLEVTGVVAKHFLTDDELTGRVQIGFMHADLRKKGDQLGTVQWSRAATQRGACLLGVRFNTPITQAEVSAIARHGTLGSGAPAKLPVSVSIAALAAIGAMAALGGYFFDKMRVSDRALAAATQQLNEKDHEFSDCQSEVNRTAAALRVALTPPAPRETATPDAGVARREGDAGAHTDAGAPSAPPAPRTGAPASAAPAVRTGGHPDFGGD